MAEHDSDRERREDSEDREPEEQHVPFDEDAAWAAIVAGYGEEPTDPPGSKPFKSIEDLALLESDTNDGASGGTDGEPKGDKGGGKGEKAKQADEPEEDRGDKPVKPLGSSVSFAPGVGPRDYSVPEPSEDDFDVDDEGHFVPPEPPPLPPADPTAKFAWLAVIGGPILLLLAVLLSWDMTWWLATLGIGGFLGGFATLVMRMKTDDEDGDDPGRGAVV
ncbi:MULTISPECIES: hypothetical protein [unclassified Streptomyces]|uniref:hypothetical protein n=1 Tax=unclassified Streptomyces TaxID=2593676 RepID=UPI00236717DD|nr:MULTISPECIES: hypothetical protein [unclassified Streptomyces]MDF3147344.1 hypothetical protein [Streptomyces sp. T21Q-yed]WDF37484.1 hypothetical protein PBV52_12090 [Streptomyces sp. T12]